MNKERLIIPPEGALIISTLLMIGFGNIGNNGLMLVSAGLVAYSAAMMIDKHYMHRNDR